MLVAKSELAFCSRAQHLAKPAFAEVLGLTSGCRERLGGWIADFTTSINTSVTSRHFGSVEVEPGSHDAMSIKPTLADMLQSFAKSARARVNSRQRARPGQTTSEAVLWVPKPGASASTSA